MFTTTRSVNPCALLSSVSEFIISTKFRWNLLYIRETSHHPTTRSLRVPAISLQGDGFKSRAIHRPGLPISEFNPGLSQRISDTQPNAKV